MKEERSAEISVIICKKLRITAAVLWLAAFLCAVSGKAEIYRIFAMLTALASASLIFKSRKTQGHYRQIASAYFAGSLLWALCEFLRLLSLLDPDAVFIKGAASKTAYWPLVFFSAGLILFAYSEYNHIHFMRMTLHTFAIAFLAFMIVQKQVLYRWGRFSLQIQMLGIVMYFFVLVFTIVLVISIFKQTNFKGHTRGTNCSAVIMIVFCIIELRWIYCIVTGLPDVTLILQAIELLGLPIYSYAQSDPALADRPAEADEIEPGTKLKNWIGWTNAAAILLIGIVLYAIHYFDARDIYLILIADLSYIVIYKSIQAGVLNEQLIEQQRMENQRLEEMVDEKTRELRQMYEELELISVTDELTGLYNRRYGVAKIEKMIEDGSSQGADTFALMLLDLDHFKQINDTYGHDIGDEVLREVGRRLNLHRSESVTPVRIGGDEFVIFAAHEDASAGSSSGNDAAGDMREEAARLAVTICREMDVPVKTSERDIQISVCVGIAIWPEDGGNREILYKLADEAMYDIKHSMTGSCYRFCRP